MSEEPTTDANHQAKHWVGWLLAPVAAPVLYVLALPVVYYGMMTDWGSDKVAAVPPWLDKMAQPYVWTMENTFLEIPLAMYDDWWLEIWTSRVPPVP